MKRCNIVGGGIGGLTAAIYLANRGMDVNLFEQQGQTGGKASEIKTDGFRFDSGPTLLTMPFVIDRISEENSIPEHRRPVITALSESCRYIFNDRTVFHAWTERKRFYEEIRKTMTDSPQKMSDYLSYSKRIYDLCSELFLFSTFHEFDRLKKAGETMSPAIIPAIDPFRSMHRANRSFFKDPKLIQFTDRYATYNGSSPYRVPATLNIIHHVEQLGASVPAGGIRELPAFLKREAEAAGAKIHCGTAVRKIVCEHRKVKGIETASGYIPGNYVLSNADVSTTYNKLLGSGFDSGASARRYRRLGPSSSALVFYWGIRDGDSRLSIHNILFSGNYRKEFNEIFKQKRCPSDPTVYIYISSKYKTDDAPDGYENWYVMINAPYICGQDWAREVELARNAVVRRIDRALDIDIESKITGEQIMTPEDIEKNSASHRGSLYGISSNSMMAAFYRQGNREKSVSGLYFAGGSAHPGGGMPLTMLSGRTCSEILAGRAGLHSPAGRFGDRR